MLSHRTPGKKLNSSACAILPYTLLYVKKETRASWKHKTGSHSPRRLTEKKKPIAHTTHPPPFFSHHASNQCPISFIPPFVWMKCHMPIRACKSGGGALQGLQPSGSHVHPSIHQCTMLDRSIDLGPSILIHASLHFHWD